MVSKFATYEGDDHGFKSEHLNFFFHSGNGDALPTLLS